MRYAPEQLEQLRNAAGRGGTGPDVSVIDATTQVAAKHFAADGDVMLVNF